MNGLSLEDIYKKIPKEERMMIPRMLASMSMSLLKRHSGMDTSSGMTGKGFQKQNRQKKLTEGESLPVLQYGDVIEDDDEATGDDEDDAARLHRKSLYPYHSELDR